MQKKQRVRLRFAAESLGFARMPDSEGQTEGEGTKVKQAKIKAFAPSPVSKNHPANFSSEVQAWGFSPGLKNTHSAISDQELNKATPDPLISQANKINGSEFFWANHSLSSFLAP